MVELLLIEQILKNYFTMQKVIQWLCIVEKQFGSVWGTW